MNSESKEIHFYYLKKKWRSLLVIESKNDGWQKNIGQAS
jgi:hypothetical protein